MKDKIDLKNILNNKIIKNFDIVYIAQRPDRGGTEFLVRKLTSFLKKKGFNINTIYFFNPTHLSLSSNEHCLNLSGPRDIRAIWYIRKVLLNITKSKKIIVHAHLTWPLYLLPFSTIGIKTLNFFTEHNTYNKRRKFKFLKPIEKYIYSKYHKITCVSTATKKNLLKWLGEIPNYQKIIVLPNGSRMFDLVIRKKLNHKKLKLVSIGSLSKQKGFDIAIQAVALLKDSVESYTIFGEGEEKKKLRALANKIGVSDKIILPGYVENIQDYLSNADLGLMPSRWEGFGLSAVEMLSTGLSIVVSDVSGLREVVDTCSAVQLVKPENPRLLAQGIQRAIKHIEYNGINETALEARKCSEKFSIDAMCERYANLYLESYHNFDFSEI